MQFNTDGIILKVQQTGEADRIVTILTRDRGIIRAFAKGAKRPRHRLHAGTGLLCYANLSVFRSPKDVYSVNEAEVVEIFFGLRDNIEKLSLAHYFCELATLFSPEGDSAEEQLRLILNSLFMLEKDRRPPLMLKAIMELRLMTAAGYMPNLVACDNCGAYESPTMYFQINEGRLLCGNCPPKGGAVALPLALVNAMRHIAFTEMKELYQFSLPDGCYAQLADVTEQFLRSRISHPFATLDFYKSSAAF
ncbi:MAG: DNA repair protein RecO [Oscillospiraceae bacterium]|jgi:DNA repair protein RecO (recombination protein O)|nr:DNA repair protein RecO [Oscillospiraceae bacterium]